MKILGASGLDWNWFFSADAIRGLAWMLEKVKVLSSRAASNDSSLLSINLTIILLCINCCD